MDFSLIKKVLWKLKWYLLIIPIACGAVTYYFISLKSKQYISKAQLATGITDHEKVVLGENETNWNVIGNKFSNFMAFIESKEIISMVSYKLLINDLTSGRPFRRPDPKTLARYKFTKEEVKNLLPHLQNKFDSLIILDNNLPSDKRLLELISVYHYDLKSLKKLLSSNRVLTSDFVKVEAKSENPYLSAFVANQYCTEIIRFNNISETRRFGNSLSFFKDLMRQKKEELELKVDTLRKFKENSNLVNYTLQSESKLNQIAQLEQSRNEELKKISSLRSAIEEIKRKIGAAGTAAGEEVFQNNKVVLLQDRIQKLSQKYYNGNTSNKRLADSIQNLRTELENRIYLLSKGTDNSDMEAKSKQELVSKKLNFEIELSMAQSNYTIIESLLHGLKSNVNTIVSSEGKISALELEINAARDEYIAIEEKYNQARNISLNSGGNLRQIEYGQPADEPEATHILLLTLVSALMGGLLVAGSGIGLVMVDRSVRTPDRFEEYTGMKALGYINKIGRKALNLDQLVELFHKDEKEKNELEQELRNLRYEIIKDKSKVVLFTSLDIKQGKSFTIFSLAYSLSQNGSKVLIIDTNFKNNSLSVLFDNFLFQNFMQKLDEGRLLSAENSSHEGDDAPSTIFFSNSEFVKKTGFENIDIIGSANSQKSPFEIFNDKDFNKLLMTLTQRYDFIFMEGSALNNYSDSKELMEFADKVVLVVGADYNITKADKQSLKFLNSLGDRMLGGVVNKVDLADIK